MGIMSNVRKEIDIGLNLNNLKLYIEYKAESQTMARLYSCHYVRGGEEIKKGREK